MPYFVKKEEVKQVVNEQPKQVENFDYAIERNRICNNCERRNPFNQTCMECGCPILELNRNKARRCPVGKW